MSERDTVGEFILLLDSANGREKFARLIQYAAKYFKWKEEVEKQRNERLVQVWGNIQSSMSTTRKFLRLFRSIAVLRAFRRSFPSSFSELNAPLFFNLSAKLFLATYFLLDHAMYAEQLGIWSPNPQISKEINTFTEGSWLGEIICTILEHLTILSSLHSNKNDYASISATSAPGVTSFIISSPPNQADLSAAYSASLRIILRNLLDLPVALHGLDWEYVRNIPHGHFGLLGAASSFLSLYEIWPVILSKE